MDAEALKTMIAAQARAEGFAAMGVCRPDAIPQAPARLAEFLRLGHHGQMGWLAERSHWRADPAALWPATQSVIMLAEPYTPAHDPLEILQHPDRAAISVYAQGRDYHDVVKKRLKRLGRWLVDAAGCEIKVFVDTAPVMEKPLAQAAGLGWQGKHTNLLSRELGNWFFLGAIFTTAELPPRCAGGRALRKLHRLPRYLPDRGVSRALPPRCAALHLVPDDRASRPGGPRVAPADGQPDLWLRRLSGGLPLEQVRGRGDRGEVCRALRSAWPAAGRACGAG